MALPTKPPGPWPPAKESGDSRLGPCADTLLSPHRGDPGLGKHLPRGHLAPLRQNPKAGGVQEDPCTVGTVCTQLLSCVRLSAPRTVAFHRSSVHRTLQTRILKWVPFSSSRGSCGGHLTPDHQGCRLTAESSPQCPSKRLNRPEAERRRGTCLSPGWPLGCHRGPYSLTVTWPLRRCSPWATFKARDPGVTLAQEEGFPKTGSGSPWVCLGALRGHRSSRPAQPSAAFPTVWEGQGPSWRGELDQLLGPLPAHLFPTPEPGKVGTNLWGSSWSTQDTRLFLLLSPGARLDKSSQGHTRGTQGL